MRHVIGTLWACASNFQAYPLLARASWREVWHYVITLVVMTSVILSLAIGRLFWRQMHELGDWLQQLPTITISDGTASFPGDSPFRLERLDTPGVGHIVVTLDRTQSSTVSPDLGDLRVLITPTAMTVGDRAKTRTFPFHEMDDLVIDDAFLAQGVRRLTWWFCGLLPVLLVLYHLVAKWLQALLWSGVAYCVLWDRVRGAYPDLVRIAVFAVGPPTVFALLLEVTLTTRAQPLLWLVYLAIYAVLFVGGTRAFLAGTRGHAPS